MSRITRNLSIIYRTERLITRRQMAVFQQQTGLMLFAALITGIGIIMLNVAAYQALSLVMQSYLAAVVVAGANLVLAAILVSVASRMSAEKDVGPAIEMRDLAIAELESDLEEAVDEVRGISRQVTQIARDPLGSALPAIIGPLLSLLLKSAKK
ncbi:phage holin family protein [Ruegeria sp. 2205SS24-7]|uniref:phage holin family protein n=1 Tax=Ruegeria discodermiae TaxID=3064389 RepID=UPI00274050ED|nr:phage holin family protein [Ruegeria sp. 2205SS24-7]MDP5216225.1 phage holin family protein [Ruegeria sp. 2205SS24-7]